MLLCPKCNHRFPAEAERPGERVQCESCGASIKVPGTVASNLDDAWLDLDAPNEKRTGEKKRSTTASSQKIDPENDPENKPAQPKSRSVPVEPEMPSEFRVICKVCTSVLYVESSEIGKKTKCPDCYSEFVIAAPRNLAKPKAKPASQAYSRDESDASEGPDIRLSEIDGMARTDTTLFHQLPSEVLARAERELLREQEKEDAVSASHAKSWLAIQFGFLQDPNVILTSLISGIILCMAFALLVWSSQTTNEFAKMTRIFSQIALVGILAPWTAYTLTCGAAILDATANRLRRVREWPAMDPTEWFSDSIMMFVAIALAGSPGSLIGYLLMIYFQVSSLVGVALIFLTIWMFVPVLILGIMENRSLLNPISKLVFESILKCAGAWLLYYAVSFAALASMLGLWIAMILQGYSVILFVGMLFPWLIYLQFYQLGMLARAIGDGLEVEKPSNLSAR